MNYKTIRLTIVSYALVVCYNAAGHIIIYFADQYDVSGESAVDLYELVKDNPCVMSQIREAMTKHDQRTTHGTTYGSDIYRY